MTSGILVRFLDISCMSFQIGQCFSLAFRLMKQLPHTLSSVYDFLSEFGLLYLHYGKTPLFLSINVAFRIAVSQNRIEEGVCKVRITILLKVLSFS